MTWQLNVNYVSLTRQDIYKKFMCDETQKENKQTDTDSTALPKIK